MQYIITIATTFIPNLTRKIALRLSKKYTTAKSDCFYIKRAKRYFKSIVNNTEYILKYLFCKLNNIMLLYALQVATNLT